MLKRMMVVALALASFAGVTMAFDTEITGDFSVDYMSKYVWRGQVLSGESVMQVGAGVTMDKLSFNAWGNMNLTDDKQNFGDEYNEFTEFDYSVDFTDELTEGVSYSLGMIYYSFPSFNNTMEAYAGLSFATMLNPTVTVYYDFDEVNSTYVNFGVSESVEVADGVALECSASLGYGDNDYNESYWGTTRDSLNDFNVTIAMPIELGTWTLTPSVTYTTLAASELRTSSPYDDSNECIYAGVGLSTTF